MLKQRIITATILIAFTLIVLFYFPPIPFLVLTALITLGGAWEWTNLMGLTRLLPRFLYLASNVILFFIALYVPVPLILLIAFAWWLLAAFIVLMYPRATIIWHSVSMRGVIGWLVLMPCWAALNFMHAQENGVGLLLFLFVLIWGADSAAYFVGNKWGKTKLAPAVSPGKSVEGVGGAVLFSVIFTLLVFSIAQVPTSEWLWGFVLSLVTVLFSILGDLFESVMKRHVGLKDSGKLLPGHGGLLDRIDSLTAAAPMFALGAFLIGGR
jgi:phosphatidate cytidylyltransferase